MKRWTRTGRWERVIATLDAEEDAQRIVAILVNHVFPMEFLFALELAQLRTFSIPSISGLLHATREYEDAGVKRLDDTRAIMAELHATPLGTPAHHEMIEHLNAIHGLYKIPNDDYLYVLSTFMLDPIFFIDRYGFRPMSAKEKDAMFFFYRRIGALMGIQELPTSRQAMVVWRRAYEARNQHYAPSNEAVAKGLLKAAGDLLPPAMRPWLTPVTTALLDDEKVRTALGLAPAAWSLRVTMHAFLWGQAHALKRFNLFELQGVKDWPIFSHFPTYPTGYERLRLGPTRALAIIERQRQAASRGDREPPTTPPR